MSSSETQREGRGDVVAEVYHGRRQDPAAQRALRERIHWICRQARGGRVLDIGCSQGIACLLLAREGVHCVGVDTRPQAIAYAQAEAAREPSEVRARLDFRQADGAQLDFPGGAFDAAILGELVEHLAQPERVLAEAVRVLKPGGRLIVTTPLGVLPDPDHKRTFWFSDFLPLLESFVRTESCGAIPGAPNYIGYVGIAGPAGAPALEARETVLRLLRETEQAGGAREEELERRVAERDRWLAEAKAHYAAEQARLEAAWAAEQARLEAAWAAQRAATQNALAALRQARDELGVITNSRGYKWLLRARRFKREFLGGPLRARAAYVGDIARKALGRRPSPVAAPAARPSGPPDEYYERGLEAFLQQAAARKPDRFVAIFACTTYIQELRGNRPMRIARILAQRGIPVLYYYERDRDEPAPPAVHPLLFQCPIGLGFAHFERVAHAQLGAKQRLFVAEYAYREYARRVEELRALGWITIYECRDDWEEFGKLGRLQGWCEYDPAVEAYLVAHVDIASAISRPLQEKLQGYPGAKQVRLSPNAYDTAFLSPGNAGRLAPRSGPAVVGYFGFLTPDWFDWDAVLEMARRRPDWRFEIIGDPEPTGLDLPANVRLFGPRSHAEINKIARSWRVAMIPFKINALSRGVDPIKIYEYLALGLPTVSFTMPQIEGYPYTFTVESVEAFLARAEEAMRMPLDRGAIDAFLAVNRWEDRVDQMLAWADAARTDPR
jgi:SAM-dependent methyltransferase